eukprot:TRINITY_DN10795_c0_g1_i2.p1 TRINITY_DN10795_c0_g1~~TRINITY_DN10795_c0_g1_i2.p1  ORF type:complete len:356 (-),score=36.35 TRINITY_DN10795_c0_g1_i2:90-1157(-)
MASEGVQYGHINNVHSTFKSQRTKYRPESGQRKVGFVLNPSSGGGDAQKKWTSILPRVRELFGENWKVLPTTKRGDAVIFAKQLISEGYNVIVSVGGDGTHNEVINGYMEEDGKNKHIEFGVLPFGTGGDLQRTMGLNLLTPEQQLELIANGHSYSTDAGLVKCASLDTPGATIERFWINVSSLGIAGSIVYGVENSWTKSLIPGRASFFLQTVKSTFLWRNRKCRWQIDGGEWSEGDIYMIATCNGQYQGGGMRMGPTADMYDGLFQIVLFIDCGVADLGVLTKIYGGGHYDPVYRPKISFHDAKTLKVETVNPSDDVFIELDGELPGKLPVQYDILPESVWLIVPSPHEQTRE